MNIRMFLEFPGLLVTIGIILLIISIVIIILAYKRENSIQIDANKLSSAKKKKDKNKKEEIEEVPVNKIGDMVIETKLEPNNENKEDTKEKREKLEVKKEETLIDDDEIEIL